VLAAAKERLAPTRKAREEIIDKVFDLGPAEIG
jgi:hypothetical protein